MDKKREVLKRLIELNSKIRRVVFSPHVTSKYSIGTRQMQTLFNLIDEDPMTMSAAAAMIKVSNQQMTKIVNTLVEKGFIKRLYDPKNRRIVLIQITSAGKKNINQLYNDISSFFTSRGVIIDDKDLDDFLYHVQFVEDFIVKIQKYF